MRDFFIWYGMINFHCFCYFSQKKETKHNNVVEEEIIKEIITH